MLLSFLIQGLFLANLQRNFAEFPNHNSSIALVYSTHPLDSVLVRFISFIFISCPIFMGVNIKILFYYTFRY